MVGGEKANVKEKRERSMLYCTAGGMAGKTKERVHSCGFSDLWSYKYLLCGQ